MTLSSFTVELEQAISREIRNVSLLPLYLFCNRSEPNVHHRLEALVVDLLPTRGFAWIALQRSQWRERIECSEFVHAVPLN